MVYYMKKKQGYFSAEEQVKIFFLYFILNFGTNSRLWRHINTANEKNHKSLLFKNTLSERKFW